jgi:hypothetical protein
MIIFNSGVPMAYNETDSTEDSDNMRSMFSPTQVDQTVRQALQICWMMLPNDRRSPEVVEAEFRRIAERAIRDFKEDHKAFNV